MGRKGLVFHLAVSGRGGMLHSSQVPCESVGERKRATTTRAAIHLFDQGLHLTSPPCTTPPSSSGAKKPWLIPCNKPDPTARVSARANRAGYVHANPLHDASHTHAHRSRPPRQPDRTMGRTTMMSLTVGGGAGIITWRSEAEEKGEVIVCYHQGSDFQVWSLSLSRSLSILCHVSLSPPKNDRLPPTTATATKCHGCKTKSYAKGWMNPTRLASGGDTMPHYPHTPAQGRDGAGRVGKHPRHEAGRKKQKAQKKNRIPSQNSQTPPVWSGPIPGVLSGVYQDPVVVCIAVAAQGEASSFCMLA